MKHFLVLVLAAGVAGCGDGDAGGGGSVGSYDQAADQTVKAMKELEGILDAVKDKASAQSAKPKLEAIAKRLASIVAAVQKLGLPGEADGQNTEEKMHQGMMSLSEKSTAYVMRVLDSPEIGEAIGESFGAVQNQLFELRGMLGG